MSFNGAHRFNIIVNRDFNQVDMSSRGNFEMMNLVNAACPGASYESAERADPPRCHPKTRKKIIEDIMDWVNSSDPEKKIMWFNGVAGAGKSAIAQTIAERGFHEGKLLSSFFFSRTATGSGRNDGSRLIPTIAYHLAIAIPEAANFIIAELNRDPAMLHHSMEVQLKRLIMDPIEQLRGTGKAYIPYLVIIDGLDECNGLQVQSGIIKTIASTLKQSPFHMRFLIVSRPEWEIQKTFSLLSINNVSVRLSLNDDSSAYHDIEVYLKSEFDKMKKTHTLAAYLSDDLNWPSKWDIWILVNRSSGQFIYALTVMKYIVNDDRDPREALNGIIHRSTENMFNENPFAQLDALYNHILSVAASKTKGGRDAIFAVLQVIVLFNNIRTFYDDQTMFSTSAMAQFLGIKKSDLELWMVHLHSIILVSADRGSIRFYHASAKDFLLDSSRSGRFFIDSIKGNIFMAQHCLATIQHMMKLRTLDTMVIVWNPIAIKEHEIYWDVQKYTLYCYFFHVMGSDFNDQLLNEFFQLQDVGIINFMICEPYYYIILALEPLFDFNFYVKNFAVPISDKAEDICRCISDAMDQYCFENYSDTEETYVNAIQTIGLEVSISKKDIECWLAAIMDCPVRGKHFYLSNDKCQFLILRILEQLCKADSGTYPIRVFGFEINKYQYIIKYLLERIKPSLEFGISVQKMLLALEILIAEFSRRVHPASLNYVMWYHDKIDINDIIEYFQDYLLQFDESHRESDDDLDFENDAYPTNPYMYLPPPATDNDEATQGSLPHTNSDLEVNKEDDEEDHNGANISDISMKGIGVDAYPTNPYIPPPVTDNEATQGSLPDTNSDLEVNEEDDEEDHSSANISNISMKCIDQNSQPRETMQDILYSPPRLRVDAYPTNPYTYLPPLSSDSNKATQGSLPDTNSDLEVSEEDDEEYHDSANISNVSMKCIDQNSQPRENMQNILHPLLDNYRNSNMEREAGKLVENDHIASAKVNKQSIERVGHVDAVSHVPEFDSNQPEVRLRAKTTGRNMLEEQIQETLVNSSGVTEVRSGNQNLWKRLLRFFK